MAPRHSDGRLRRLSFVLIVMSMLAATTVLRGQSAYEKFLDQMNAWKTQQEESQRRALDEKTGRNSAGEQAELKALEKRAGFTNTAAYNRLTNEIKQKYSELDGRALAAYQKAMAGIREAYYQKLSGYWVIWSTGEMKQWKVRPEDTFSGQLTGFQQSGDGWTALWTAYRGDGKLDGKWELSLKYADGRITVSEGHSRQLWLGTCSGTPSDSSMTCTGTEKTDTTFNFSIRLSR